MVPVYWKRNTTDPKLALESSISAEPSDRAPAKGFEPLATQSPYITTVGPFYTRLVETSWVVGLRVQAHHCNTQGNLHGGMVGTLADIAIGRNIAAVLFEQGRLTGQVKNSPFATVNLSTDFVGTAVIGDWIEVHVDVQKAGRNLAFANAYIHNKEQKIARVSGIFRVFLEHNES